jgi:hypothetical protein
MMMMMVMMMMVVMMMSTDHEAVFSADPVPSSIVGSKLFLSALFPKPSVTVGKCIANICTETY